MNGLLSTLTHAVNYSASYFVKQILANLNVGYYRVLYDEHFTALLHAQLKSDMESIGEASRSQIIDDYFSAAYEGYTTFKTAFDMAEFMNTETSYASWIPFLKHLRKPYTLFMSDAAQRDKLKVRYTRFCELD